LPKVILGNVLCLAHADNAEITYITAITKTARPFNAVQLSHIRVSSSTGQICPKRQSSRNGKLDNQPLPVYVAVNFS
jgi:hypothetical protein